MINYLWFPKHHRFHCNTWDLVVSAKICPDQRRYRRLTRAERVEYERGHSNKFR